MKIDKFLLTVAFSAGLASCNMDEEYYSTVTPETFFTSKQNIEAVVGRPFQHWKGYIGDKTWYPQEYTTDEFVNPARTTNDWYNSGRFIRLHYHGVMPSDSDATTIYKQTMQGVARCLAAIDDLSHADYQACGVTEEEMKGYIGQLNALMGYFYFHALDFYGGVPIYNSPNEGLKPRATANETFLHTEKLLKQAVADCQMKSALGAAEHGYISKGAAAMLLAQLYFNAEALIGEARYRDAANICQEILNGVYGPYKLGDTWNDVFGFDNVTSPEMMWCCPSSLTYNRIDWYFSHCMPYWANEYFGVTTERGRANNGGCLAPSRNPKDELYMKTNPEIKLGSPYEKFEDTDLRKKPYRYLGKKQFEGMFLVGDLVNPNDSKRSATYYRAYKKNQTVHLNDHIAPYSQLKSYDPKKGIYNSLDELPSHMDKCAEEDDGIRLVKQPVPMEDEYTLLYASAWPAIRYAEVYYTLAECKLRAGDKKGAAELINTVRKRNFKDGEDPNPVTAANLDMYRMADEWMIEFLGEGRRRTDLIRMGFYVTEKWWDHEPSNDNNKNKFPIGDSVLGSNSLLKQNPGYATENVLSADEM